MKKILILSCTSLLLAGCSVQPEPFSLDELAAQGDSNYRRMAQNQEPVTRSITLYEAMARAIKYNLDYRVEMMEKAVANSRLKLTRYDMLPELVTTSGYTGRDKERYSRSAGLLSGDSLNFSRSSERHNYVHDLSLSWSILDFGLSRVRAYQTADKVLIAEERKRKVINRIIEDVRTAYWRAVSAERLVTQLRTLEREVRSAIRDSKNVVEDGDSSPLTALTYQRELIEIKAKIQGLLDELKDAKIQLSSLMNLKPGTRFRLSKKSYRKPRLRVKYSMKKMIKLALRNRPELREVAYKRRINAQEAEAALLEMLPGINLNAGLYYDTNTFLHDSNWVGWGAKVGWNLLKVIRYPYKMDEIEGQDKALDEQALATTMAVITQIHVSRMRFYHAHKKLVTSQQYLNVQRKILNQIDAEAAAGKVSEQTLIREKMNTMVARVKKDIAYAELQNAFANIFASMGLPPYSVDMRMDQSVRSMSKSLRRLWKHRGVRVARR